MERGDVVWAAIRIFGLFMLVKAVMALPEIVSSTIALRTLVTVPMPEDAGVYSKMAAEMTNVAAANLCGSVFRGLLYALSAFYLLRHGGWLFRIISPPSARTPRPRQGDIASR